MAELIFLISILQNVLTQHTEIAFKGEIQDVKKPKESSSYPVFSYIIIRYLLEIVATDDSSPGTY